MSSSCQPDIHRENGDNNYYNYYNYYYYYYNNNNNNNNNNNSVSADSCDNHATSQYTALHHRIAQTFHSRSDTSE